MSAAATASRPCHPPVEISLPNIGAAIDTGDAATIYEAAHRGYQVEFLSDASGSLPYRNEAGAASAEEIHRVFSTVFHSSFAAVVDTARWQAAVRDGVALEQDNVYLSHQRALVG